MPVAKIHCLLRSFSALCSVVEGGQEASQLGYPPPQIAARDHHGKAWGQGVSPEATSEHFLEQ